MNGNLIDSNTTPNTPNPTPPTSPPSTSTIPGSTSSQTDDINGNWSDVQRFLNSRARGGTDLETLSRTIDANSRAAQIALFGGEVLIPETEQNRGNVSAPTRGGTVIRAFWWGFHIQISHEDVQGVISAIEGAETLINAITPVAPAKVRPFLPLALVFLDASKAVLQAVDRGNGVYISMSWFLAGVLVPTSV